VATITTTAAAATKETANEDKRRLKTKRQNQYSRKDLFNMGG
jgi:hypothetical protein